MDGRSQYTLLQGEENSERLSPSMNGEVMNNNPLVSIPVITYNSSSYIIEGLESIKTQTYKNIELIISDDCSTDNTVELCREWLEKNNDFFVRTELVATDKNTGVAGNLNRAIRACQGEWIKGLSGDDKFLPDTIEEYVKFANNNKSAELICGKFLFYGNDEKSVINTERFYKNYDYPRMRLNREQQRKENLKDLFVPGPGLFYKRTLLIELNGFDEKYPFCEEDPFMFKFYESGRKVYFLEKEVYCYQIRQQSLGRENAHKCINRNLADKIHFYKEVKRAEMLKNRLISHVFQNDVLYRMFEAKDNGNRLHFLFYKFIYLFVPLRYVNYSKYISLKIKGYLKK